MNEHYPFENPPLPYAYDALEPYIDTLTMHLHHDRHLQTYVENLNKALAGYPALHSWPLERLLTNADRLPAAIQTAVTNNGGGVYNHVFYFNGMSPSDTRNQAGELYNAIVRDFGSADAFFEAFKKAALAVFGSGYAWLVLNKNGRLSIVETANQHTPIAKGLCPIATIDVWEHAYYLKHYNERAKYIDDWFHVADWSRGVRCIRRAWRACKDRTALLTQI